MKQLHVLNTTEINLNYTIKLSKVAAYFFINLIDIKLMNFAKIFKISSLFVFICKFTRYRINRRIFKSKMGNKA